MELAENVIPTPRFRVTEFVIAGFSVPLRSALAVGEALMYSTSARTSSRSARSQATYLSWRNLNQRSKS